MQTVTETGTKTLNFTVNTTYNRQDVGPDYFDGPVEVDAKWAKIFIEQGRAVEVVAEPVIEGQGSIELGETGEDDETAPVTNEGDETEPVVEKTGLDTESAKAVVTKPTSKKK